MAAPQILICGAAQHITGKCGKRQGIDVLNSPAACRFYAAK
jgi:hypothetical protein